MKENLLVFGAVATAAIAGSWIGSVEPVVHPEFKQKHLRVGEEHAGAGLLGQFRTSVTSWLWQKTDLYLHNGVEMRKLSAGELRGGAEVAHNEDHDDDALCESGSLTTVIPERERDFRGVFGDIERATATYQDMQSHAHNNPKAALPLFRLMTVVDPQFAPAWVMEGSILARDRNSAATEAALTTLRRGLYECPDSLSIRVQLAELMITRNKDLSGAAIVLEEAARQGSMRLEELDEEDAEALNNAFRWWALCLRDLGKTGEMRVVARRGLGIFPKDGALQRLLSVNGVAPFPTILRKTPRH